MANPDGGPASFYPLKNRSLIYCAVTYCHTYKWKHVDFSLLVGEHLDAPEAAVLKSLLLTCSTSFPTASSVRTDETCALAFGLFGNLCKWIYLYVAGTPAYAPTVASSAQSRGLEEQLEFLLTHMGAIGKQCQASSAWWFSFFLAGSRRRGSINGVICNFSLLICKVMYLLITVAENEHHIKNWG